MTEAQAQHYLCWHRHAELKIISRIDLRKQTVTFESSQRRMLDATPNYDLSISILVELKWSEESEDMGDSCLCTKFGVRSLKVFRKNTFYKWPVRRNGRPSHNIALLAQSVRVKDHLSNTPNSFRNNQLDGWTHSMRANKISAVTSDYQVLLNMI